MDTVLLVFATGPQLCGAWRRTRGWREDWNVEPGGMLIGPGYVNMLAAQWYEAWSFFLGLSCPSGSGPRQSQTKFFSKSFSHAVILIAWLVATVLSMWPPLLRKRTCDFLYSCADAQEESKSDAFLLWLFNNNCAVSNINSMKKHDVDFLYRAFKGNFSFLSSANMWLVGIVLLLKTVCLVCRMQFVWSFFILF